MLALLVLFVLVASVLVVPLLLVGLILRLVIGLAILPIRLAALVIRLGLGLAFGLAAIAVGGTLLLIPLLPVLLLAGAIWLVFRIVRGRPVRMAPV